MRVGRLGFANSSTCALILAKPARLGKLDVANSSTCVLKSAKAPGWGGKEGPVCRFEHLCARICKPEVVGSRGGSNWQTGGGKEKFWFADSSMVCGQARARALAGGKGL